ncbi:Ser/Thr-rich protein T10 in DGCR region [Termitomyces sp. J132]|nr:Ser/Thr-rich protein T10 in DGCR region [Termitomyces sp. J132]
MIGRLLNELSYLGSILCSNRDELLRRPTLDAHFHNFEAKTEDGSVEGNILSGRDILAGGTWFGVTRTGKVALLTNISEPPVKACKFSRGSLTSFFLLSDSFEPLEGEVRRIIPQEAFAGFNLLLFKPTAPQANGQLHYDSLLVTNHGAGGSIQCRPLSAKERICGCVSNAIDGDNAVWPKVEHVTLDFAAILQTLSSDTTENELVEQMFNILNWHPPEHITDRSQLRNTVHVLPFPITVEGAPQGDNRYGTRLSTILLIKKTGDALFIERDIWTLADGEVIRVDPRTQRVFRFHVKQPIKP